MSARRQRRTRRRWRRWQALVRLVKGQLVETSVGYIPAARGPRKMRVKRLVELCQRQRLALQQQMGPASAGQILARAWRNGRVPTRVPVHCRELTSSHSATVRIDRSEWVRGRPGVKARRPGAIGTGLG